MVDKKRNLYVKSKVEQNEYILKKLELLKAQIISKRDELQDICSHDLILCYGTTKNDELKKARCLTCGNYFELDGTFDMFTECDVNKDSIIDITDIISDEICNRSIYGKDLIYLRAKDKFEELLKSEKELSLDMLKMHIINDLIMYERDLKVKKLEKVKID